MILSAPEVGRGALERESTTVTQATSRILTALASVCALHACTLAPIHRAPSSASYSVSSLPQAADPFPNWALDPERIEDLILNHAHVLEAASQAGGGTTGAEKVTLRFPSAEVSLDFKWKRMDGGWKPFWGRLDGVNNSPRKELTAWKIQSLFLDPPDHVTPLTMAYCVPIADVTHGETTPTLADTQCVLGVIAVWLSDVTLPDPMLDSDRFNRDYVYAYHLANLNLFTYLIKHHDGRAGNFVVSKDDERRQVFAIDNGVSFGGIFYNWFVENWNSIRVPALRKESIDRLRKLSEEDLQQLLGVVAQLELNENDVYVNVPAGMNLDDDRGVRIEGRILQLGLTEDEIDDVWDRIQDLIEDVDEGDVPTF